MDIHELETLSAVIDAGGFNRAAKQLHLTQSAVSQTIARMEAKLGTPLVVRSKPPRLTPAGSRVMTFAHRMLEEMGTLQRDLADIARPPRGRVRLGASRMVTNLYMCPILSRLAEIYPGISVDVANLPGRELVLRVKKGDLELGFGAFERRMDEFETHPYLREQFCLYASPRHPSFRGIRQGDEAALKRAVLLTSFLDPVENRPGPRRLRYRFAGVWQIESLNLRVEMIANGLGIGYLPQAIVRGHELRTSLRHVSKFQHATFERQLGLYHSTRRPLSKAATELVELCGEHFSRKRRRLGGP